MNDQPAPIESEVRVGDLSFADVQELIDDIKKTATDVDVRVRSEPDNPVSLDQIKPLMLAGDLEHAQLRYQFDGRLWIDTLTRTPQGVRLVRTSHPVEDETEAIT